MKIDWAAKLTSRKFWAAIVGVVTAGMAVANIDNVSQEQIIGLISSASVLIAYIIGEGLVDAARIKNDSQKDNKNEPP